MPARLAALLTAFCKLLSWMWWRRIAPLRGSWERLEAGKTYCQIHSRLALGEVLLNLRSAHLSGVALIMEEDEVLDPVDVGLLSANGIVLETDGILNLIEQFLSHFSSSTDIAF